MKTYTINNEKRFYTFLLKYKDFLGIVILICITVGYHLFYINKVFPLSEQWGEFYCGLIDQGKIPYKDFYYYLPPLNLLIDCVVWKLSFGYILIYRCWRLLERLIIVLIMYKIMRKKVSVPVSVTACFMGIVFGVANGYDAVGDYNQTSVLLTVLLCLFVLKYFEDKSSARYIDLFLSGLIGGLMFLCKQPVFLASGICFALFFVFKWIINKEKTFYIEMILVLLGALIPIGICLGYLLYNNAFEDFVYQVFTDTGNKGSLLHILFSSLFDGFNDRFIGAIISLLLIWWYAQKERINNSIIRKYKNGILILGILLVIGSFGKSSEITIMTLFSTGLVLVLFPSFGLMFKTENSIKATGYFFGLIIIITIILRTGFNDIAKLINREEAAFELINILINISFWLIVIFFCHKLIMCIQKKEIIDYYYFTIALVAISIGWTTSMSNGGAGVPPIASFIIVPVFISLLYKFFRNSFYSDIWKISLTVFAIVYIIGFSQRIVDPYAWHGYRDTDIWEKTEESEIKSLKGFKFSKNQKILFDEMTKVIKSNSNENSIIFGFPYVKLYNVFVDNYNMVGNVPVLFYDVCASDFAVDTAVHLKEHEPDIVVWLDIPGCLEYHEKVYTSGIHLGQREIITWFSKIKDSDYTLIGQVDNLFVYKLNNDIPVGYTYIENKFVKNKTAEIDYIK